MGEAVKARRWFRPRFSIRLLLLLITVVALVTAYFHQQATIRRKAVAAVLDAGGYVEDPTETGWVARLLGEEYFTRIESCPGLRDKLSNEHLVAVSRIPELKHVQNNRMWAGSLIGTFAVAGGMKTTGDGALIDDRGIKALSRARNLESIILWNTLATDDGMASLSSLPKLQYLMIGSPDITDRSIEHLATMSSLKQFWISGKITPEGVEKLQAALPGCKIITDPGDGSF